MPFLHFLSRQHHAVLAVCGPCQRAVTGLKASPGEEIVPSHHPRHQEQGCSRLAASFLIVTGDGCGHFMGAGEIILCGAWRCRWKLARLKHRSRSMPMDHGSKVSADSFHTEPLSRSADALQDRRSSRLTQGQTTILAPIHDSRGTSSPVGGFWAVVGSQGEPTCFRTHELPHDKLQTVVLLAFGVFIMRSRLICWSNS